MNRDKPFRIQQDKKHKDHKNLISGWLDKKAQKEPCAPPCPQEKKKKQ